MLHDLKFALRGLRRRPVYAIVAVSILAVGLSASIAVFTYVNGFYQPFPGVNADGLVRLFGVEDESPYADISYLDFLDYAAADGAFAGIAAAQPYYAASVRQEAFTEVAFLEAVSGDYFSVLEVEMGIGRGLGADDDRAGAAPVAVLSHSWWQRSFNGDPEVIGSIIYLNFRPYTVVGVASPAFLGSPSDYRPDVWIPLAPFADRYTSWARAAENRDIPLVRLYGRLRDGAHREQALAELQAVAAGLDETYPRLEASRRLRLDVATWIDPRSRLAETPTVRMMTAAAGGLLLLVCANVANLLLSVAAGRQRELALQASLGASPARLLRQALAENVVLATCAGVVAMLLASPLSARLGSYFARPSVWGANVSRVATVDLRVVAFAFMISLATGLVAGILPALWASRRDLVATLKTGSEGSAGAANRLWGRRGPSSHDLLVAAQVALSVVLLVVAGLILRTLVSASSVDPGFSYDSLLTSHISTSSTTLEVEDREQFFREVAERISDEPWVRVATVVDNALLAPQASSQFEIEGRSDPASLNVSRVIPGFFEALGIEVQRGRSFTVNDTRESADVAIVNETLARRFFPEQEAVGRRLSWPLSEDAEARSFEIVGVVRDIRSGDFLAEPDAMVYFAYPQHAYPTGSALIVSVIGDPPTSIARLSRWLRDFEPHLAIVNVLPYSEVVRGSLYTQRMNAEMFSALAILGLGLATVGIFSVMSLAVSRRTREIGIRMAIGAQRRDINRMMLGRALIPVVLGLALGLVGALAATGLVQSLLYGVAPTDPVSMIAGVAVLVVAALLAAYLPARRATKVDPVSALRRER